MDRAVAGRPLLACLLALSLLCPALSGGRRAWADTDVQKYARLVLRRPPLAGWVGLAPWWKLAGLPAAPAGLPKPYTHWAVAREHLVYTYGTYGKKAWRWGRVRQGQRLAVRLQKAGDGCRKGSWYATPGDAYLCSSHGFAITQDAGPVETRRPPDLDQALPYAYFKPKAKPALQFTELPRRKEVRAAVKALRAGKAMPDGITRIDGAFFIARDKRVKRDGITFYRSIAGNYLREKNLRRVVKTSTMRGELLDDDGIRLPVAFVHRERTPIYCRVRARLLRCGVAKRHARFAVTGEISLGGKAYVREPDKRLLSGDAVRVARKIARPSGIAANEKWVHFDLTQQVLVAYEGDRPVFTTLFSSGKEGHDTPAGTFRIYIKRISSRMSGDDPNDGPYDIGEVPWVMYYKDNLAVHGAYWHDVFGEVRSHGCTNLAPADARWLYFWTEPRLPMGWHGMYVGSGTAFHYTR